MKILTIVLLAANLLVVRAGVLGDIADALHKDIYKVVKTSVFTAQEVIGLPLKLDDIKFFYFNKHNRGQERVLKPLEPKELAHTDGKIFFLIHGWFHTKKNNPWYGGLTDGLLSMYPDATIVQVDWEKGSTQEYSFAAFSTQSVGKMIAELIKRLVEDYKVPISKFTCIGHSLGGQMCGWTGKYVKKLMKKELPRIIALDPAGPLFWLRPDAKRLNKNDAEVVEVIHTDGGTLGMFDPCGTIDFYPNGGSNQPGCLRVYPEQMLKNIELMYCSHGRACEILIEAIRTVGSFPARKCNNMEDMKDKNCHGTEMVLGDLETKEEGIYTFETNSESPFSTGLLF
ncbi:hypothetical protein WA026_017340 [Henosepilachna vigintioctopunctata]|uniref:Lipase domain-containing protein n=1 Tax=Henosepilachna vigintioctopunctata TaxID=420089 RepID=A0AAW1TMF8_9CUCU